MCMLWAQASNFMPSLKLCQVFLQQPVSLLFYNSTYHPHHISALFLSFFFHFPNCTPHVPSLFACDSPAWFSPPPHFSLYCNVKHPSSSSVSPPPLYTAMCGCQAQAVLSILVLHCRFIVASNPVKMLWEYCINLSVSLSTPPPPSLFLPPHL